MGMRGPKPKRKEVIWSPEVAYAVGLMASDGCLSPDGRHLDLTSKDLEQIENIRACFGIKALPSTKRRSSDLSKGICYRVQWSDVRLYGFLLDVGLTPRKSLTLGVLKVPDEYFFDFLRGSFDGDGSFYSYFDPRWKSSFMFYLNFSTASKEHALWIQETITRLCGPKGHISATGKKRLMYNLRYAKKESTIVLSRMYPKSNTMLLSRKRLKISRALGIVGMSLVEH